MKRAVIWDLVLGCGVAVAFLLLGQMAWHALGGSGTPDLWSIISSIATVGATSVALYVALTSIRAKNHEDAVKARLAAAQLAPILLQSVAKLDAARQILEMELKTGVHQQYLLRAAHIVTEVAEWQPGYSDLTAVASLRDDCADRIAAGFAQAKLISQMMNQDEDFLRVDQRHNTDRTEMIGAYIGMTKGILQMLEPAVATCNQVAKIKIGGPAVK